MKKIMTLFIVVCLLLQCGFVVAAEGAAVQAKLNPETFTVEISGSGFASLEGVFLVIAPKDIPLQRVIQYNEFVYSDQPIADSKGGFVINADLKAGTLMGTYTVHAVDSRTGMIVTAEIFYKGAADYADILIQFNENVTDVTGMKTALDTYGSELIPDMSEYLAAPAAQQRIAELLFELRGSSFADIMDLRQDFKVAGLLGAMPYAANPAGLLNKYRSVLDEGAADAFFACTDAQQAAAGTHLKSKTFASTTELETALPEAIFVGKANTAKVASELQALFMTEYASQLSLDTTDYDKITNKTKVFSNLLALPTPKFSGFADAAMKFQFAAKSVKDGTQSGGGNGGGFGGGASGSGGGIASGSTGSSAAGGTGSYVPSANQAQLAITQYYSDLGSVSWAIEHINSLTELGIISGDGNGEFRPNDTVTRAEFVKMIVSAFSIPIGDSDTNFHDVSVDAWFAPYIAAAASNGIVTGISDTYFGADEKITRQDLTVLCFRAAAWASMTLSKNISAVPKDLERVAEYAKSAVCEFYEAGIINGDESGAFNPTNNATRAEAAKIVSGILELKGGY